MSKPRQYANTKVYHVILRGVNRQAIFFDDEDRAYMVETLWRMQWWEEKVGKQEFNKPENAEKHRSYVLYSYCLMDNHIHLLLKNDEEEIGNCIRRIEDAYVKYFNARWDRVGHLFQGRFKSEPCEDRQYFLQLLHYIHYNPVKAHMVSQCADYLWSSARELTGIRTSFQTDGISIITYREAVWKSVSRDDIIYLLTQPCTFLGMEDEEKITLTDQQIWQIVSKTIPASNIQQFSQLDKLLQEKAVMALILRGVNKFRITRLLGLTKHMVYKIGNQVCPRFRSREQRQLIITNKGHNTALLKYKNFSLTLDPQKTGKPLPLSNPVDVLPPSGQVPIPLDSDEYRYLRIIDDNKILIVEL